MTILAAVNCGDHLLIASDSMAYDQKAALKYDEVKLWPVEGMAIVFGCAGSTPMGDDFRRWLHAANKTEFSDWQALKGKATEFLTHLNGQQRQLAAIARSSEVPDVSALLAGYIDGEPQILLIEPTGLSSLARENEIVFDGQPHARSAATAAHRALQRERGEAFSHDAESLRRIMEIVTEVSLGTAPPIQMWRVNPGGPEKLQ